jgi:hypothetical protein
LLIRQKCCLKTEIDVDSTVAPLLSVYRLVWGHGACRETIWRQVGDRLGTGWRQVGDELKTGWRHDGDTLETRWRPVGDKLETS